MDVEVFLLVPLAPLAFEFIAEKHLYILGCAKKLIGVNQPLRQVVFKGCIRCFHVTAFLGRMLGVRGSVRSVVSGRR